MCLMMCFVMCLGVNRGEVGILTAYDGATGVDFAAFLGKNPESLFIHPENTMTIRLSKHPENPAGPWFFVLLAVLGAFLVPAVLAAQEFATPQEIAEDIHPPGSLGAAEDTEEVPAAEALPVTRARLVGPPGHRHVEAVRPFMPQAGRVSWSRQGDWIAYDQVGEDGLYDIRLKEIDGYGGEKCLTCEHWEFRKSNALDPVWHPSGEYLLFRLQRHARRLKLNPARLAGVPRGLHSEIWMIDRKGRDFLQITYVTDQGGAVVDPHFSYEGDRLVWTERLDSTIGRWGEWGLRVAELKNRRGVVRLGKVRTYRPAVAPDFTLAHSFTPNDRGLLISAMSSPGDGERARDIFRLDLETEAVENLTSSHDQREASVTVAPRNSDLMVWVSSRGIERRGRTRLPYRGDLWLHNASTGSEERLTFFNHPDSDHALGEALIDDLAWSPDGDRLLLHVVSAGEPPKRRVVVKPGETAPPPMPMEEVVYSEGIYVVEFGPTFLE